MNTIEVGELLYEYTVKFTGVTEPSKKNEYSTPFNHQTRLSESSVQVDTHYRMLRGKLPRVISLTDLCARTPLA